METVDETKLVSVLGIYALYVHYEISDHLDKKNYSEAVAACEDIILSLTGTKPNYTIRFEGDWTVIHVRHAGKTYDYMY